MAHGVTQHDFKKLDIKKEEDLASSLSSNGQDIQEGIVDDVQDDGSTNLATSTIPDSDLSSSWYPGDDNPALADPGNSATDARQEEGADDPELQFRRRGTSISFHPHATLDDGAQHSLEHPLPKSGSQRRRDHDRTDTCDSSTSQSPAGSWSDSDRLRINPFTGEPVRRRTRRSGDIPKLETLNSTNDVNMQTPVLTSGSFVPSPVSSPSISPAIGSSTASTPWSVPRQTSTRSTRTTSLRQSSSRRNSRRSMSSASFSPASAFLSRLNSDSIASANPDPDDEGQSFGLNNEFIIGRTLGSGGFSTVKEALSISPDGNKVKQAVKIVRKILDTADEGENDRLQARLEHEVAIWRYLRHTNILTLHAVYDTEFATFCVSDLVGGGSLYDSVLATRRNGSRSLPQSLSTATLCNSPGSGHGQTRAESGPVRNNSVKKGLPKDLARTYAWQLACALRYLHQDVRVAHRDIKLENCLIDHGDAGPESRMGTPTRNNSRRRNDASTIRKSTGTAGVLKLCDFGLADWISSSSSPVGGGSGDVSDTEASGGNSMNTNADSRARPEAKRRGEEENDFPQIIGTLAYAAPESLRHRRRRPRSQTGINTNIDTNTSTNTAADAVEADTGIVDTAVDIWAFGIVLFALCTGNLPFRHALPGRMVGLILEGRWDEEAVRSAWDDGYDASEGNDGKKDVDGVGKEGGNQEVDEVLELLRGCLDTDRDRRWGIDEVLGARWFRECGDPYEG